MTTTEIMNDKTVIGTEKVDLSKKASEDKIVKTHSEHSDNVNKNKAKMEADNVVGSAKKVDAALRGPADSTIKTHSEPSETVNKDNVKIVVDKAAGIAKDSNLKAAVETGQKSGIVKDRS